MHYTEPKKRKLSYLNYLGILVQSVTGTEGYFEQATWQMWFLFLFLQLGLILISSKA